MKISSVSIRYLRIPFRFPFPHALSGRSESESIVCVVRDIGGAIGYGEGAPRYYVTGESLEQSQKGARVLANKILGLETTSLNELLSFLTSLGASEVARRNPAAWCAIELSMLDLFSRQVDQPIWKLFTTKPKCKLVKYSAVIPMVTGERLLELCRFIKELDLDSIKIKLKDPNKGLETLRLFRSVFGQRANLRVDFNGALSPEDSIQFIKNATSFHITAVEQPVEKFDLDGLKNVASNSSVPIIADESLYTNRGPHYLLDHKICHGLNVRISSCGGILKSVDLLQKCRRNKIMSLIGAQVGETAILTAAALNVAAIFGTPDYMEGGAGSYLLYEDISANDISFGKKGKADVPSEPGLGIDVDDQILTKWSDIVFTLP